MPRMGLEPDGRAPSSCPGSGRAGFPAPPLGRPAGCPAAARRPPAARRPNRGVSPPSCSPSASDGIPWRRPRPSVLADGERNSVRRRWFGRRAAGVPRPATRSAGPRPSPAAPGRAPRGGACRPRPGIAPWLVRRAVYLAHRRARASASSPTGVPQPRRASAAARIRGRPHPRPTRFRRGPRPRQTKGRRRVPEGRRRLRAPVRGGPPRLPAAPPRRAYPRGATGPGLP